MNSVITVKNLSKRYFLNSAARNTTLRDLLANLWRKKTAVESGEFWALRDVSFTVEAGETLGIVGKNGAGKSTLLKILSRITKPTMGNAQISGRVGSLLEVGTGFHQELSGRENIFLNGAILGMKRAEIARKYDEIIAFAEIEKFIETPVKFYSSGMFMRLAFSVAAHLEPDILIVDEVLAVGDSDFQHKCLDKMQQIMNEGRTILFVSHNMSAVTRLCRRAIALNQGEIVQVGAAQTVVSDYLNAGWGITAEKIWENPPGDEVVKLLRARVCNENGKTTGSVEMNRRAGIEIVYEVLQDGHFLIPNFHVFNGERLYLFAIQDVATEWRTRARKPGIYTTTAWLPENIFAEGRLIIEIAISAHVPATRVHLRTDEVVSVEIIENPNVNLTRGDFQGNFPGIIRPAVEWTTQT